jgi:hypothetical protein
MAMSGVTVDDEVVNTYENRMRIKKEGEALPPLGCLFLKLSDDQKKIVLDKTFEAGSLEFEKLKEELPKDEGRYVLYDYS